MRTKRVHIITTILAVPFLCLVLLNTMAYWHAHSMLHFTDTGVQTQHPESLSFTGKLRALFHGVDIPRPHNTITPGDVGLAFTTHTFDSGGLMLEGWYVPVEDPRGMVVLFHGYAAAKSCLLTAAKILHDLQLSTFLIDFPGSGGSDGNSTTAGFREADDVASTVLFVRNLTGATPLILYGRSMGGAAILKAIAAGEVSADAVITEAVYDRMLSAVKNRFAAMGIPSFPCAQLLTFWGGRQFGFNAFEHNPADYAVNASCPVLMLHGSKDQRATIAQGRNIFNNLAGPGHFEVFPAGGHEACFEVDPDRWKQAVDDFLREYLTRDV